MTSARFYQGITLPLSLIASGILISHAALAAQEQDVSIEASVKNSPKKMETMVVTAIREEARLTDTAASIGVLTDEQVQAIAPTHPEQLLNRIPGVNIVQIGSSGEGHMAAIRQPVSTKPVYLFLENGVPVRSPAFYNHNGLYEVNVAGSRGAEVIKGPGSALYGSDAIGGVVNILSGQARGEDRTTLGVETGSAGWKRATVDGTSSYDTNDFSYNLNLSDNDGWRDHTESRKATFSGGWGASISDTLSSHTLLTFSRIDMNTGGSGLSYDDFKNDPKKPGNLIGYRDVSAFRLSSAISKEFDSGTVTVTPYLRRNDLEYIATWTLRTGRISPRTGKIDSQDAHINESGHDSAGVLLKYSHDMNDDAVLITGLDLDYSKGYQKQTYIERTDTDPGRYWQSYRKAGLLYDYEADFSSISPYIHYEQPLSDTVRLSAGLRYDSVQYDYHNKLSTDLTDPLHKRPGDQKIRFHHTSPKLGLTWQVMPQMNAFASWRHGFRIPTAGQLFRAGRNADSTDLKPVKAENYEIGVRGEELGIRYETTFYYLQKKDDILSIADPDTGVRSNSNAGETRHYGVEAGFGYDLTDDLTLDLTYTRSRHKYHKWESRQGDFSGNEMPDAPEWTAGAYLNWTPALLNGGRSEWEVTSRGAHWIDEKNDDDNNASDRDKYDGHTLVNWRTSYQFDKALQVYLNVLNLTNRRYAETTGKYGPTYTPGRPRTVIAGLKYTL